MRILALILAPLALPCCGDQSDVGKSCPMQVSAEEPAGSASSVNFPTVIEINADFPCDSLTCVATSGQPPYCTRECLDDTSCPGAFECRVVVTVGSNLENSASFAGRHYCVWRGCRVQLECGDVSKYDCIGGFYGPDMPPGLCGPAQN